MPLNWSPVGVILFICISVALVTVSKTKSNSNILVYFQSTKTITKSMPLLKLELKVNQYLD